jgi:hypothetical protein
MQTSCVITMLMRQKHEIQIFQKNASSLQISNQAFLVNSRIHEKSLPVIAHINRVAAIESEILVHCRTRAINDLKKILICPPNLGCIEKNENGYDYQTVLGCKHGFLLAEKVERHFSSPFLVASASTSKECLSSDTLRQMAA